MRNVMKINFDEFIDNRGNLVALEFPKNLPFKIERVYYIYNVPDKEERGFHSHRDLEQILICLGGTVKIRLKNQGSEEVVTLNRPNEGLYIGPMIWREMYQFSNNATLMVLASRCYNTKDYIKDYNNYVQQATEYFEQEKKLDEFLVGMNIKLDLVKVEDANFLLKLRTESNLNKYLSKVDDSLEKQEKWIQNYKMREYAKKEYYFKCMDKLNNNVGFARLYNIDYENKMLTFGSFIMGENKPQYAALETMILLMQIAFDFLKMEKVVLDVRKKNLHAKRFYERFGFEKYNQNDIDEFYELNRDKFIDLYTRKYHYYIGGATYEN